MSTPEEIIQALSQPDPATFESVINTAYQQRHDPSEASAQTVQQELDTTLPAGWELEGNRVISRG